MGLVERRYEVKDLDKEVKAYVRVCHEYQVLKFNKSKKHGWLNPLPIPHTQPLEYSEQEADWIV